MTDDEKAARSGAILGAIVVSLIAGLFGFMIFMAATENFRTEIQRFEYTEIDRMTREFPVLSEPARELAKKGWVSKRDYGKLTQQYEQLLFEKQKKELFQKLEVK